jgi:hypothetical protein
LSKAEYARRTFGDKDAEKEKTPEQTGDEKLVEHAHELRLS